MEFCCFDNRGTGGSSDPPLCKAPTWTCDDFADDAAALVNHLGWSRYHVVGVSMGGMISQRLALLHLNRLDSLTLAVTNRAFYQLVPAGILLLRKLSPDTDKDEAADVMMRVLFGPHTLDDDARYNEQRTLLKERLVSARVNTQTAQGAHSRAVTRHYMRDEDLLRIRASGIPTIAIGATHDNLVSPYGTTSICEVLGIEPIMAERAGHAIVGAPGIPARIFAHINNSAVALPVDEREPSASVTGPVPVDPRPRWPRDAALEAALALSCKHRYPCAISSLLRPLADAPRTFAAAVFAMAVLHFARGAKARQGIGSVVGVGIGLRALKLVGIVTMLRASVRAAACVANGVAAWSQVRQKPPSKAVAHGLGLPVSTAVLSPVAACLAIALARRLA